MLPQWDPDFERRVKELLYRFLEELGVTKAALYLVGDQGTFEQVAQYGFGRRDVLAATVQTGHPLWDFVRRNRTQPAFVNGAADDRALTAMLEGAGTDRLLTVPITIGDRLLGFVDARDKARRALYDSADLPVARVIGTAFETFLAPHFGFRPAPAAAPAPASAPPEERPSEPRVPVEGLDGRGLADLVAGLKTCMRFPGLGAAVLTVTDGRTVRATALCGGTIDPHQREVLADHQLRQLPGLTLPAPAAWGWSEQTCEGLDRRYEAIRTAVLHSGPPVWLVLSVLSPAASRSAEPLLAVAARLLGASRQVQAYRRAARNFARAFLEPGETAFPHLRQHAQAVSELAQRMAVALGASEDEEELVTVAAYLHDVGMRELEYAHIYRMERPGEAERRTYRRHSQVGARLLEGAAFPGELAAVVRSHHERWDGGGYPDRLAGRQIPSASRLIHLVEVWDTLTSPGSYRRPVPRDTALGIVKGEAGKQFDPDLVPVLADLVAP